MNTPDIANPPSVKQMPANEKYLKVVEQTIFIRRMVAAFVTEHISPEAVTELEKVWLRDTTPVPEDATPEEGYEIAYANYMAVAAAGMKLIRERLGREGLFEWVGAEVEGLKNDNAGPAVQLLHLFRRAAPAMAFKSAARRVGDEIGWLTPYTVTEFSDDKAVFDIAHCKVLDYPGSEDVCHYGCQLVLPKWQAEQFGVRLNFKREGHACTCTVTPLDQSETPPEPAE